VNGVPASAVLAVGYVGLDHVVGLNRAIAPGRTSLVERRHTPAGGRLGGCAPNICLLYTLTLPTTERV
jgi:hypothetical protein